MNRKLLSLVVCFIMLFNIGTASFATSQPNFSVDENMQVIYNNEQSTKVKVRSENGEVTAEINKNTKQIILESYDYKTNKRELYDAVIQEITNDSIVAKLNESNNLLTLSNKLNLNGIKRTITGEEESSYIIESTNGKIKVEQPDSERRFVWLLALAPEVVAALYAVAATSLIFTAVGVTWYAGTAIVEMVKEQKRRNVEYFSAMIDKKNNRVIVGAPLTLEKAIAAVASGADVMAVDDSRAKKLCLKFGGALRKEIHGPWPDYMWHYHPYNKQKVHVFIPLR